MRVRASWLSALILAEVVALATFHTAPDLAQSLYWQTGMLTYLLPLMLATFFIGWVTRARGTGVWSLLVSAGVTFIAGGLSETYLIPQNVALSLALIGSVLLLRDDRRTIVAAHLVAGWLGGVLALAAIVLAPATAGRIGGTPADLWLASAASIATAAYQAGRLFVDFLPIVVLCLALPTVVSTLAPPEESTTANWSLWMLLSLGVAITLPFCYFPSFYAQNGNPPARSLIVPGSILVAYLVYTGCALAPSLHRWLEHAPAAARVGAVAMLALVPLGVAATTLPQRAAAAERATLWDAEDSLIRAGRDAGAQHLVVPPLPPYLGENFITTDPANWFNQCVARYYGLESIAASSDA
jgi:hypothetical protein